jgi:KaiC/GvpD/RAD55 family RecA-like ATPase
MTTGFLENLLRYLIQYREASDFIEDIDAEIFDTPLHKIFVDILKKFYSKYHRVPGIESIQQVIKQELQTSNQRQVTSELNKSLETLVYRLYNQPLDKGDADFSRDTISRLIGEKRANLFIKKYATGGITLEQLASNLALLKNGHKKLELTLDGLLLADDGTDLIENVNPAATFLKDLNNLTSDGGFYAPQLVIIMSGPKHFKTGLIIKLGVEFARNGYRVYYGDTENGKRSLKSRAKQAILECTKDELRDPGLQEEFNKTLHAFGFYMGGDIYIDYWPAYTTTIADVENKINMLKEHRNWEPDIIILDSIDHYIPSNPLDQKQDERHKINKVYHEVIAMNSRLDTFAIAPSQVNRKALAKKTFDVTDLGEDFRKAANAHAVFAICANDDELERGIRRIVPVVQREGVRKGVCVVQIDESRMMVDEVNAEAYMASLTDD